MPVTEFSIAEIEQQIESVSAALEKAKAQELVQAEQAFAFAQKSAETAQLKVADLKAKPLATAAAQARLATAEAALARQNDLLNSASQLLDSLLAKRKTAAKIKKKANKILAKTFKKYAKALRKDEKKAKKLAKQAAEQEAAPAAEGSNASLKVAPPAKKARAKTTRKIPVPELAPETRPLLEVEQSLDVPSELNPTADAPAIVELDHSSAPTDAPDPVREPGHNIEQIDKDINPRE
ncbi:MAG TPA: hypothetical protein VN030_05060 [Cellvibrio sp.]|nr:hypothetical protein [Cellvibrio sp.]